MELFNKEGHLTDEGLRAVVDGTLDEMGRLEASEHLSFCDSCLVRYTELLADDTLLVPEMPLTPTVLARVRRRGGRGVFHRYPRGSRRCGIRGGAVGYWRIQQPCAGPHHPPAGAGPDHGAHQRRNARE